MSNLKRYAVFIGVIAVLFLTLTVALAQLQLVQGEDLYEQSVNGMLRELTVRGARGQILDRNGIPLAYDQKSYDVHFTRNPSKKTAADYTEYTRIIMDTIAIVERNGGTTVSTFSIKKDEQGAFYFDWGNITDEAAVSREHRWRENMYIDAKYDTPEKVYRTLRARYCLPEELTDEQAFQVLSVWQESQLISYMSYVPVTVARNVNMQTVTEIEQSNISLADISIAESTVRIYRKNELAWHVVGYTGRMYDEAMIEQMLLKQYSINDLAGLSGIEYTMEEQLSGNIGIRQGKRVVEVNSRGMITREIEYTPPKNGNNVVLTIDSKLQKHLEDALKENILDTQHSEQELYQEDQETYDKKVSDRSVDIRYASMGAAIIMDVTNGDVLAMASYPSYDNNLFSTRPDNAALKAMQADPSAPLMNKAIASKGTPGSIFKMVPGVGGVMDEKIQLSDTIDCLGEYRKYMQSESGKAPTCWIKLGYAAHAHQNLEEALKNSCNYYFFEVASRLGIDELNRWAELLGLTSKTNIELPYEQVGQVANQQVVFDATKPVTVSDQKISRSVTVLNSIKRYIQSVGADMGVEYDDQLLNDAITQMMTIYIENTTESIGPEIRRILTDVVGMPQSVMRINSMHLTIASYLSEIRWNSNDTLQTAVGQSVTEVTPIAVARYICALLNGGKVYDATIVDKVIDPQGNVVQETEPKLVRDLNLPIELQEAIKEGMSKVVSPEDGGTAGKHFEGFEYLESIGGKTGTAQVSQIDIEDNAWFVAFTPREKPEIVIVVYIPHGYSGSWATYTAREIIQYYMDQKKELSPDNIPTPNALIP